MSSILVFMVALLLLGAEPAIAASDMTLEEALRIHRERLDDPPAPAEVLMLQTTESSPHVQVGPFVSVQVNVDPFGDNIVGDAANEPSIAVSPLDPSRIVIGWRQFDSVMSNMREAGYAISEDAGATWNFKGVLEEDVFRTDPVLGTDADGNFYYSSLTAVPIAGEQLEDFRVALFKSLDGGATWLDPVDAFGGDKQWMTIDRTMSSGRGHIYQTWNSFFSCCGVADFDRSTDGGSSFEAPLAVGPRMYWGSLDVDPDGTLYLVGAVIARLVGLGALDTPGSASGVDVVGGLAYVADGGSGLRVIDVSDTAVPVEIGSLDTPGSAWSVAVVDGVAYVADGISGLRVIDVSNPTSPAELGFLDTPGNAGSVAVVNGLAYIAAGAAGLRVIDVSNPISPVELGFFDTPGRAQDVAVAGDVAYVADGRSGLRVIDVSDPASPVEIGSSDTPGYTWGVELAGDLAYLADGDRGLRAIDVSNPRSPDAIAAFDTPGYAYSVAVVGDVAYVADGGSGLRVIDISDLDWTHIVVRSDNAKYAAETPSFSFVRGIQLGGRTDAFADPNPDGLLGQVWVATDRSSGPTRGNVYVLGSVNPPGPSDMLDVHLIRSSDGGETWSEPIRVNDDPVERGAVQWFGMLSVAPNGRLDAIWNDTRNDPGNFVSEVYYAASFDAGESWTSNVAVTPPFDPRLGYPDQRKLGDYYHMVSDDAGASLAYAATFNGEQDVYFLRIPAPARDVRIDIKPGSDPNSINLADDGVIPVAILGSDAFDVADVDAATLTFGPDAARPDHSHGPHVEDVNADGLPDLVAHFRTEETGIAFGQGSACLHGATLEGTPFSACDAVRTVPDMDGDRLLDTEEATLGTHPLRLDTDGDGFGDGEEVLVLRSDPLDPRDPAPAEQPKRRGRRRR